VFPANLYKTTLLLPETGSLDFRVFLWHGHGYSTNKFFLIVLKISGSSDSGSASNHRSISIVRKKGLLYQVGLCCAKAQRNGTLDPASGATLPVGMDVVLVAYEVGPPVVAGDEQFVGAVDEFTVTAEPGASLEIRTVISASPTIPGSYANPILETANGVAGHVRGSWPYSAISLSAQDSVDLAAESSVRYEVGAADGAEEKMFTPRPGDSGARTNRGLYGVNVHYEMPFVNTSDPLQRYSIQGYFRARGIFAKYYGAVVEVLNAGIPPIGDGSPGETAVVQWPTQTAGREIPVFLLDNATGGACGTPVDLTFA
jgi:hypothetical protein